MLVLVIFFEIELSRAALVDDPPNMLAIISVDIRRNRCKDSICITALANILSLNVTDDHSGVEAVVNGAGSGEIDALLRDCRLIRIV